MHCIYFILTGFWVLILFLQFWYEGLVFLLLLLFSELFDLVITLFLYTIIGGTKLYELCFTFQMTAVSCKFPFVVFVSAVIWQFVCCGQFVNKITFKKFILYIHLYSPQQTNYQITAIVCYWIITHVSSSEELFYLSRYYSDKCFLVVI